MEKQNQLFSRELDGQPKEFYLDVDEAAEVLGVSRAKLLALAELGIVPGYKLWHGNRYCWKFKRSELADLVGDGLRIQGISIQ
jgi:excisionase family DNA binding protein